MVSIATNTSPHRATVFIQMFPLYLGYFFAGHLIFHSTRNIKTLYLILFFILFGVLTAVGHYYESIYTKGNYFYQNFSITIVPMSICLMFLIKKFHYFGFNPEVQMWILIPLTAVTITIMSLFVAYIFSKISYLKNTI